MVFRVQCLFLLINHERCPLFKIFLFQYQHCWKLLMVMEPEMASQDRTGECHRLVVFPFKWRNNKSKKTDGTCLVLYKISKQSNIIIFLCCFQYQWRLLSFYFTLKFWIASTYPHLIWSASISAWQTGISLLIVKQIIVNTKKRWNRSDLESNPCIFWSNIKRSNMFVN